MTINIYLLKEKNQENMKKKEGRAIYKYFFTKFKKRSQLSKHRIKQSQFSPQKNIILLYFYLLLTELHYFDISFRYLGQCYLLLFFSLFLPVSIFIFILFSLVWRETMSKWLNMMNFKHKLVWLLIRIDGFHIL